MTDEQLMADLIRAHLERYAEARMIDVYKLLHQATFGPGHLVTNKKAAREYLEQEMRQLPTSGAAQPLIENIHPDGVLVRLHLRPYVALTPHLKPLLEAFIRSAEQVKGDTALMAARWGLFISLAVEDAELSARFDMRELRLFGAVRAHENWPAFSHSPEYTAIYRPHYRVLTAAEAAALCNRIHAPYQVV